MYKNGSFFVVILILFLLLIILIFTATYYANHKKTYNAFAQDPNPPGSPTWCADHCNPSPATNPCNQSESYKFPDCCVELAKTGDPFACGWPDRGYCLDSQCASIPEDVVKQRCGAPKHSWCDLCTSNKCPGFGGNPIVSAKPTVLPTSPFYPSPSPIQPSTFPSMFPTNTPPLYSTGPSVNPTFPPYFIPTATKTPSQFSFPQFFRTSQPITNQPPPQGLHFPALLPHLPQIPIISFLSPVLQLITKIDSQVPKTLDIFEDIFKKITLYDQQLESFINQKLLNFRYRLLGK